MVTQCQAFLLTRPELRDVFAGGHGVSLAPSIHPSIPIVVRWGAGRGGEGEWMRSGPVVGAHVVLGQARDHDATEMAGQRLSPPPPSHPPAFFPLLPSPGLSPPPSSILPTVSVPFCQHTVYRSVACAACPALCCVCTARPSTPGTRRHHTATPSPPASALSSGSRCIRALISCSGADLPFASV